MLADDFFRLLLFHNDTRPIKIVLQNQQVQISLKDSKGLQSKDENNPFIL